KLFAAAAEDEGIAALQPDHGLAGSGAGYEQLVDLPLRHAVPALGFADRDQLGLAARMIEHALAHQPVVEDDIGRFQRAYRLHSEKLGVSGAGANEEHAALTMRCRGGGLDRFADQRLGLVLVALEHGLGGGALEHRLPEFPPPR